MKIVHLSTYTAQGGAGIATVRIHKKILEKGIDSSMLVFRSAELSIKGVKEVKKDFFFRFRDYFFYRIDNLLFRRQIRPGAHQFSFNYLRRNSISSHPLIKNADVVCLYWVGANFLTPKQIGKINKPLVWRLSDMWPFSGGCHYSAGCTRYEEHCGSCPQLITTKKKDFTWFQWKRKHDAWKNKKITIISPSTWIANAAGRSSLFRDNPIIRIPTGVDHNVFKPINKVKSRETLRIPLASKVILFGAKNALESSYKGGSFFKRMMEQLADNDYTFLIFGSDKTLHTDDIYRKVRFLGELQNEKDLCNAYNSADIFICPSTEDNLPNTVLESMACGTPCVAFKDSGGVVDAIDHKKSGYLAEFKNVNDLVNGILWLSEANKSGEISARAREKILQEFTLEKQVDSLISVYKSILNKNVLSKQTGSSTTA